MNETNKLGIYTIGHSTRTLDEFLMILRANGIASVIDIRSVPRSRYNPQFNTDTLSIFLNSSDIRYLHMREMGGLRHPNSDSRNIGWRNTSFRGFADYMQTGEFEQNLQCLIQRATRETSVLMCAETLPWRCHRSLIADALLIRGIEVEHILGAGSHRPHQLTPWAKVQGITITYPVPLLVSATTISDNAMH